MPQHYLKAMVEVSVWCKTCHRETMHRVDDRRRGPCLECLRKLEQAHAARQDKSEPPRQGELFR